MNTPIINTRAATRISKEDGEQAEADAGLPTLEYKKIESRNCV